MSKSEKKASVVARGEQPKNSVYDFLYHDVARIGSFLAQFDDSGLLQQVTATDAIAKGGRRGVSVSAGGGVPLLGEGSLGFEISPAEAGSESLSRVYDPLWTNARTFLDFLASYNLIRRDLEEARIGQFVLVRGSLSIADIGFLKELWHLPAMKKAMRSGAESSTNLTRQQRRAGARHNGGELPSETELALEVIPLLPHVIQAQLDAVGFKVWSSLRKDGLSVSSSDMLLKHGTVIPGEWSVLGVLDAWPDDDTRSAPAGISPSGNLMSTLLATLGDPVRATFGRPSEAYGVTPLLIFREITSLNL